MKDGVYVEFMEPDEEPSPSVWRINSRTADGSVNTTWTPEPAEPSSEPPEPSSEPPEPSSEPPEPSLEPTEPSSEPAEPAEPSPEQNRPQNQQNRPQNQEDPLTAYPPGTSGARPRWPLHSSS